MIQKLVFKGIENYSRHLEGRSEGSHRPHCFIIYLTTEWFLDESHVTIPQLKGCIMAIKREKVT